MDLTAHNDSVNRADRQAGAEEIEITQEMIRAGKEPLGYFDNDLMGDEYEAEAERVVREIYMAMRLASLAGSRR